MYYKATFDLGRPVEVKIPEERNILEKMQAVPLFNNPPTPFPVFETALDLQDQRLSEAENGGKALTSALRTQVALVDRMVASYRDYVTIAAKGDKDVILSSGFRPNKERTPAGHMGKVENVKTKFPGISGSIDLSWKPIVGKQFYELELRPAEDPKNPPIPPVVPPTPDPTPTPPAGPAAPAPENNNIPDMRVRTWRLIPWASSRVTLTGLTPFVRHQLRIRARGKSGYGEWSDIIEFTVL